MSAGRTERNIMDSYQPIFDQVYANFGSNDYGNLVFALEAVFKAAGYGISGQELSGAQHDRMVGSVGQTDLTTIAQAYIAWVLIPSPYDGSMPFVVGQILKGDLPLGLYDLARAPLIAGEQRNRWQVTFDYWLKEGKIRRNTKRYRSLIAEHAPEALIPFRQAAVRAIESRQRKLLELHAEAEGEHAKVENWAANLRRTATIIEAFCMVSEAIDECGKSLDLPRLAEQAERAVEMRRKAVENALAGRHEVDETVRASLIPYPDLAALWEKALELEEAEAPNATTGMEVESRSILGSDWKDAPVATLKEMVEKGSAPLDTFERLARGKLVFSTLGTLVFRRKQEEAAK